MATRDPDGPIHAPISLAHPLFEGVVTETVPAVKYENGLLSELFRHEWTGPGRVFQTDEPIVHLYTVFSPHGEMRKEWYFHEHTIDRYIVLSGVLDIGLYDGRPDSPTFGNFDVLHLSEPGTTLPSSVRIPPGVWHSLRWETPSGLFINAKTPPYRRDLVDKFRVPLDELPSAITWNVE